MEITVRLYLTFRAGRFRVEKRECATGMTAADLARDLAIRDAEIGMVLVNDRQVEPQHPLRAGDIVSLFPVVGGG